MKFYPWWNTVGVLPLTLKASSFHPLVFSAQKIMKQSWKRRIIDSRWQISLLTFLWLSCTLSPQFQANPCEILFASNTLMPVLSLSLPHGNDCAAALLVQHLRSTSVNTPNVLAWCREGDVMYSPVGRFKVAIPLLLCYTLLTSQPTKGCPWSPRCSTKPCRSFIRRQLLSTTVTYAMSAQWWLMPYRICCVST